MFLPIMIPWVKEAVLCMVKNTRCTQLVHSMAFQPICPDRSGRRLITIHQGHPGKIAFSLQGIAAGYDNLLLLCQIPKRIRPAVKLLQTVCHNGKEEIYMVQAVIPRLNPLCPFLRIPQFCIQLPDLVAVRVFFRGNDIGLNLYDTPVQQM